jgi:probable HAF family extracellular repeat protein
MPFGVVLFARCLIMFGTAIALAMLTAAGSQAATFRVLGPGASSPRGVSADGSVVVGVDQSTPNGEAIRWTASTGIVRLGHLPGGGFSLAQDVSDDGSIVVGYSSSDAADLFEAFRWTAASGMVGMGFLPGGSPDSEALSISGDGNTIVGVTSSSSGDQAFRWTAASGMVGLGDLPGGSFRSAAFDVSSDGSVIVGNSSTATSSQIAFRWMSGTGLVAVGDLPGGIESSSATAVSADGSTIVGFSSSAATAANPPQAGRTFWEAFRWTAGGGMAPLGDLSGGVFDSQARAVSGDGLRVVGFSHTAGNTSNGSEAFLW